MKILLTTSLFLLSFIVLWGIGAISSNTKSAAKPNQQIIHLSEQLLSNVSYETSTDSLESVLAKIKMSDLISGLSNDNARKTFWINIYNSYYQILAVREKKKNPKYFLKS